MIMIGSRTICTVNLLRYFSASAAPVRATPNAKAAGKPSKRDLVLREGYQWLNGPGKRFDNLSARNWLHPKRPFPKNPWFVPTTPVGDATRQEIYDLYKEDPVKWTPRQLALKYELSVIRIEAILRLKHLEKKQAADGYILQRKFSSEMERMMGVDGQGGIKIRENPQLFYQPPCTADGGSADKAPSLSNQSNDTSPSFDRRPDGNYVMALSGVASQPEAPVQILEESNPREMNSRWRFLIADISKSSKSEDERTILVRDHDGTLRTATRSERLAHLEQYPVDENEKASFKRHLWEI